jgi:hypothetical protein
MKWMSPRRYFPFFFYSRFLGWISVRDALLSASTYRFLSNKIYGKSLGTGRVCSMVRCLFSGCCRCAEVFSVGRSCIAQRDVCLFGPRVCNGRFPPFTIAIFAFTSAIPADALAPGLHPRRERNDLDARPGIKPRHTGT